MTNIFTYGSLMFEPVTYGLVKGVYKHSSALLTGYKRRQVIGAVYPGITASPNDSIRGQLWYGVSPSDVEILDKFQTNEYLRTQVTVTTQTGEEVTAHVYVFVDTGRLAQSDWDVERFKEKSMANFIHTRFN